MSAAVAITGAAGFIGSHAAGALAAHPNGPPLRLGVHRRPLPFVPQGPHTLCATDLNDPASLRALCEGAGALLHCASQIGGSPRQLQAVNVDGTRSLMAAAARAKVSRIVYLSTASVYGRGRYRDAAVAGLPVRPASATSRSRALAERIVLDAGGIVVRPYLVYGHGDIWVVPGLARLLRGCGPQPPRPDSLLSVIDAADLGRALAALATAPAAALTASVYHANHPAPVTGAQLLDAVSRLDPAPEGGWPDPADERAGGRPGNRPERSAGLERALAMVAGDHWFASTALWHDTGCAPGSEFTAGFEKYTDWYVSLLRADGDAR